MIEQENRVELTFNQANEYAWFLVALEKELSTLFIDVHDDFYIKDLNG